MSEQRSRMNEQDKDQYGRQVLLLSSGRTNEGIESIEGIVNSNHIYCINNCVLLSSLKVEMVPIVCSGNGAGARETTPDMTF